MSKYDKVRGSLFGAAFGDALGRPTEFMKMPEINKRYPYTAFMTPGLVTDDTEMMIATGHALIAGDQLGDGGKEQASRALEDAYLDWATWPKDGRAPGVTCMGSLSRLARGRAAMPGRRWAWRFATNLSSKGCGANMRVQPVAFLPTSLHQRAGLAQLSAAITHAHPTALAAAELTMAAIDMAAHGEKLDTLPEALMAYCWDQRNTYHTDYLGDLYTLTNRGGLTPGDWIEAGWRECWYAMEKVVRAQPVIDWRQDPCTWTGEGWIAEEALATALYCVKLAKGDPVETLHRAIRTGGDSDSIACLAGSIVGAYHGSAAAWPISWTANVEYADKLEDLSTLLGD